MFAQTKHTRKRRSQHHTSKVHRPRTTPVANTTTRSVASLPDYLQFLFTQTIIKHVPVLRRQLCALDAKASILFPSPNRRVMFVIDHFDDPHLTLHSIRKPPRKPYSFYPSLPRNGVCNTSHRGFWSSVVVRLRCDATEYNGREVVAVDGLPFRKWMWKETSSYAHPELRCPRNGPLFMATVFALVDHCSPIRHLTLPPKVLR